MRPVHGRRLQPDAVILSDAGPDVRWCGTESGVVAETNWSPVDPAGVPYPGADGPLVVDALRHGDPEGTVHHPAEADTSIRPGWFHHPAEDAKVRSVDALLDLYVTSVGRNSKLLLNVPPTRDGLLHEIDVARLAGFRDRLGALVDEDVARGRSVSWRRTGERTAAAGVDLGRLTPITVVRLEEPIAQGQAEAVTRSMNTARLSRSATRSSSRRYIMCPDSGVRAGALPPLRERVCSEARAEIPSPP